MNLAPHVPADAPEAEATAAEASTHGRTEHVQRLRRDVSDGNYRPDAGAIADILLERWRAPVVSIRR
jgi:anti-sigma28 factor (negative regulator of flagellin synthesis)